MTSRTKGLGPNRVLPGLASARLHEILDEEAQIRVRTLSRPLRHFVLFRTLARKNELGSGFGGGRPRRAQMGQLPRIGRVAGSIATAAALGRLKPLQQVLG